MRRYRGGEVALLATVASVLVGVAYFNYLKATPFPPNWVRVIPCIWLIGAVAGLLRGLAASTAGPRRILGGISALLSLPNVGFAAIYAFAALMGG